MSYEFKDHNTMAGEDVVILTLTGMEVKGEVVADTEFGYYVRVTQEGGQEYYVPKSTVLLVTAQSRKVGGSNG